MKQDEKDQNFEETDLGYNLLRLALLFLSVSWVRVVVDGLKTLMDWK